MRRGDATAALSIPVTSLLHVSRTADNAIKLAFNADVQRRVIDEWRKWIGVMTAVACVWDSPCQFGHPDEAEHVHDMDRLRTHSDSIPQTSRREWFTKWARRRFPQVSAMNNAISCMAFACNTIRVSIRFTSFTAPDALGQLYLISHRRGNRKPGEESERLNAEIDAPSNLRCAHIMNNRARVQRSASSRDARLKGNREARGCSVEEEKEEEEKDIEMRSGRSKAKREENLFDEGRENKHLCAHGPICFTASRCDCAKNSV